MAGAASGDWWDGAYGHRRYIERDNSTGTEALTDVPILVKLDATGIDYTAAAADGHDLRFVDASGKLLSHEVEAWVPGGESVVWLKLPMLPGPGKAAFDLYFGN